MTCETHIRCIRWLNIIFSGRAGQNTDVKVSGRSFVGSDSCTNKLVDICKSTLISSLFIRPVLCHPFGSVLGATGNYKIKCDVTDYLRCSFFFFSIPMFFSLYLSFSLFIFTSVLSQKFPYLSLQLA